MKPTTVSPQQTEQIEALPEAVIDSDKGLPVVWLLPLVALLVGGWLIYKTVSEKGADITISFKTAEGIEKGKTQVKLKDVPVGTVRAVSFSEDLSRVLVRVTMMKSADRYLTDKTRFWVVRPRVGIGSISGLGTLVSGAYIALDPSSAGKPTLNFIGLEKPPAITADRKGTSYRLKATGLGSLSVGSPVYFRQFAVGEVTEYSLSKDHEFVDIDIFVEAPHDHFIHAGTHFWNASGVDISMTAAGVKLGLESIVSLLRGGIAFETTPEGERTPVAEDGHHFNLFGNRNESLEQPITQTITFALKFTGSVRGLDVGAPVEYRGIRIGTVKTIELGEDSPGAGILSPIVIISIEPQRMEAYDTVAGSAAAKKDRQTLQKDPLARARMDVEKLGLRARLQNGSLLTGKRFVDIDFFPDAPPATLGWNGKYPEIPTLPGSLEGILASIQHLLDQLDKSDLNSTVKNLNHLMISTGNLMAVLAKDAPQLSEDLHGTLAEARQALQQASRTLNTVDHAASPESDISQQLQDALEEISAAARSVHVMADYLERHPEALLKGKANP